MVDPAKTPQADQRPTQNLIMALGAIGFASSPEAWAELIDSAGAERPTNAR